MREPEQLPLLAWANNQEVHVIAFPADKRIGRIRSIAKVMRGRKSEGSQNAYLSKSVSKFTDQLNAFGIDNTEAELQIQKFEKAIWSEFTRLGFLESCT